MTETWTAAQAREYQRTGRKPGSPLFADDAEKAKRPRLHLEDDLQAAVCEYLDFCGVLYMAVPNGGRRPLLEAVRMKRLGVKPGAPDLIVFLDPRAVLLELKAGRGRLSPEQRSFAQRARALGFPFYECRTLNDVIRAIEAQRGSG